MSEAVAIHRSRRGFFSGTLLSRCSGLVRDMSMAAFFGADPSVAALLIAFRLTNFIRRLFGEGGMQSAFIPQFEEMRLHSKKEAGCFFRDLYFLLFGFLVLSVAAFEGAFAFFSENEVVRLSGILLPGVIFLTFYALNSAFLLSFYSTFTASLAPMLLNILWIAAIFFLRNEPAPYAMHVLAWVLLFGYFCQWLLTVPKTAYAYSTLSTPFFEGIQPFSKSNRKLLASLSLSLVGVSATQVNSLVDALFARGASLSGPVYLWYALRIEQLPFALFGLAIVTSAFPAISSAMKGKKVEALKKTLQKTIHALLTLLIPCTVAMLVLGGDLIQLLFCHLNYSIEDGNLTTHALFAYSFSLVPALFVLLFSYLFYSQNNYRVPAKISVLMVFVNVLFNSFFLYVLKLGVVSIAVATAATAWINAAVLYANCRKTVPMQLPKEFSKIILASFLAGALCLLFQGMPFLIKCILFIVVNAAVLYGTNATDSLDLLLSFLPYRKKSLLKDV